MTAAGLTLLFATSVVTSSVRAPPTVLIIATAADPARAARVIASHLSGLPIELQVLSPDVWPANVAGKAEVVQDLATEYDAIAVLWLDTVDGRTLLRLAARTREPLLVWGTANAGSADGFEGLAVVARSSCL